MKIPFVAIGLSLIAIGFGAMLFYMNLRQLMLYGTLIIMAICLIISFKRERSGPYF